MAKKTNEQFLKEIYSLTQDEYCVIEEYNGANNKIEFIHRKCNRNFKMTPHSFLRGSRCPICYKEKFIESTIKRNKENSGVPSKKRLKNEEFLKRVYDLVKEEYTFLEEYVTSSTKIKVIHNICGHEYYVSPNKFLFGRRCPKCKSKVVAEKESIKVEEYQNRINSIYNNRWTVIKFEGIAKKVSIMCNKCNKIYNFSHSNNILQGTTFCECDEKNFKSKIKTKKELELIEYCNNNNYELINNYENSRKHVLIRCLKCNNIWNVSPSNLKSGYGCNSCKSSKMELSTKKFLEDNNIDFISQKTFDDLKYIQKLRFDFYIPSLNMVIELDGRQHYEVVDYFGGEDSFEKQKIKDKLKDEYCKKNNIHIIRIPYWDSDNIHQILQKEMEVIK